MSVKVLIENHLYKFTCNEIFGEIWVYPFGSTIAFLASAVINNFLNWSIGKASHKNPDGKLAYTFRTFITKEV